MPVRNCLGTLQNSYGAAQPHLTLEDGLPCMCDDERCCNHGEFKLKSLDDDSTKDDKGRNGKNGSKVLDSIEPKVTLFFPPPLAHSSQPGVLSSALYSGSKFGGCQKSKDSSYDVEVIVKVCLHFF